MGALRQYENRNTKCPKCNGRCVKAGRTKETKRQKYRCNECRFTFVPELYEGEK